MKWGICGFTYRDQLWDFEGSQLGGVERQQRILQISRKAAADARLEIFLHEYCHAWLFHVPEPRVVEQICDFYASATSAFLRDLARQGGMMKLLAMGEGTVKAIQPTILQGVVSPIERRGLRCDGCLTPVATGSVARERIEAHPVQLVPAIKLGFYCEHCNHVQQWHEIVNGTGQESGTDCHDTVFLKGAECIAWIKAHPKETGIIMRD